MRPKQSFLVSILISAKFILSCANVLKSIETYSLENEVREIDLIDLGVAADLYAYSSFNKSLCDIVQPITFQNIAGFPTILSAISTSELFLNDGVIQKAILYSNETKNLNVYLSLYLISNSFSMKPSLSELVSFNITKLIGSLSNPSVSLYAEGQGILIYSGLDTSSIQQFQFSEESGIQFNAAQNLNKSFEQIIAKETPNGYTSFLSYSTIKKLLYLWNITTSGVPSIINSINICSSLESTSIPKILLNGFIFSVRCVGSGVTYEQYSIDYNRQQIDLFTSISINQTVGEVYDVKYVGSTLYVLEKIDQLPYTLQLTSVVQQNTQLSINSQTLISPVSTSVILQCIISPQADIINLITTSDIIGLQISIGRQIFQYSLLFLLNSTESASIVSANSFGPLIIIENSSQTVATQIQPFIPKIKFIQIQLTQQYYVFFENDTLNRKLNITSILFKTIPITQYLESAILTNQVIQQASSSFSIPLEEYIKGSDLQISLTTVENSVVNCTESLNSITQLNVENIYIKPSDINAIFPTNNEYILVQLKTISSTDINYTYIYCQFMQLLQSYYLQPITLLTSPFDIYKIDSAGSFTFQDVSQNNWIVLYLFQLSDGPQIFPIPSNCNMSSSFLFSSDPTSNIIATSCDNQITVYTFVYYPQFLIHVSISSFTLTYPDNTLLHAIESMQLFRSGTLIVTDNHTILAFNVRRAVYIGAVFVPEIIKETLSKVFLFESSFIYAKAATLTQLSYNNFSNTDAIHLRALLEISYIWDNFKSDFSNLIPCLNINADQEYILVPGQNSNSQKVSIVYRLSNIISQNQLYSSLVAIPNTIYVFGTPQYMGFFSSSMINLYSLNYFLSIEGNFTVSSPSFQQGISYSQQILIQSQSGSSVLQNTTLNLNIQRNLSSVLGNVNGNSSQVKTLQSYYVKNNLQSNSQLGFIDSNFYNANLYGWWIPQSLNNVNLQATILQRIQVQQYKNEVGYTDILSIMSNVFIYSNSTSIILGDKILFSNSSGFKSNFIQDNSQKQSNSQQSTIQVTVYALVTSISNSNDVTLSQFVIIGDYSQNNNSPTVKVISNNKFYLNTDIFHLQEIIAITNDSSLGLIMQVQPLASIISLIFKVTLDTEKLTFSLDSTSLLAVNNLQIVYIAFCQATQKNLFFSLAGIIYYDFNEGLTIYSTFSILNYYYPTNQVTQMSQITQISLLNDGSFIIEIDNYSLSNIVFTSNINNPSYQLQIQSSIQLSQESNFSFTGSAFSLNSGSQFIIVSKKTPYDGNYYFFVYEQYSYASIINSQYVIYSSAIATILLPPNTFRFISSVNPTLQVLAKIESDQNLSCLFQLTINSAVDILIQSSNTQNGFSGTAFGISPLEVISTTQNSILLQANINENPIITYSALSLNPSIVIMIAILLVI